MKIKRPDNSVDGAIIGETLCSTLPRDHLRDWLSSGDGLCLVRETYRVLKPGAYVASRTNDFAYDLVTVGYRLAGFEVRDTILWMCADRWWTIVLLRKPLCGTVAENTARHGVGGLHIDACRIPAEGGSPSLKNREQARKRGTGPGVPGRYKHTLSDRTSPERYMQDRPGELLGRWPPNLLHDESVVLGEFFPKFTQIDEVDTWLRRLIAPEDAVVIDPFEAYDDPSR